MQPCKNGSTAKKKTVQVGMRRNLWVRGSWIWIGEGIEGSEIEESEESESIESEMDESEIK